MVTGLWPFFAYFSLFTIYHVYRTLLIATMQVHMLSRVRTVSGAATQRKATHGAARHRALSRMLNICTTMVDNASDSLFCC